MNNNTTDVKLAKSITIVFFTSGIRWLLGCVRIAIIAFLFGAKFAYDAYLVAFTIPDMIGGLLVGVIDITFIPIFTDHLSKDGEQKAWEFASNLLNIFFIVGLLFILVIIITAPYVIRIVAPGFNQETFQLAVRLITVIIPIILIVSLAEFFMRILYTYQHFVVPVLIRILEVIVVIISLILFSERYGIFSLAYGLLLGAGLRLILQIPLLWNKFKYIRPGLNLGLPGIKKINLVAGPLILCMLFLRIGMVVERILASTLKEGSISVLSYARTFTEVPAELLLGSFGVVLFPLISKCAAEGKFIDFRAILSRGIRIGNFVLAPIAILFIFFGKEIIQSLLERGQFISSITQDTSIALAIYALGLFAMAVWFFGAHACYALHEVKAAVKITAFAMFVDIALKLILVNYISFAGLALATSIARIIQGCLLIKFVKEKIGSIDEKMIASSSSKILGASFLMVGMCWLVLGFVSPGIDKLIKLTVLIATAGVSYLFFSYLLRSQEFAMLKDIFKKMAASKA